MKEDINIGDINKIDDENIIDIYKYKYNYKDINENDSKIILQAINITKQINPECSEYFDDISSDTRKTIVDEIRKTSGEICRLVKKSKNESTNPLEKSNNPPEKSGINVSQLEPPYSRGSLPQTNWVSYKKPKIKTNPSTSQDDQKKKPIGVASDAAQILKQYLRRKTKAGAAAQLQAAQELELAADTESAVDSNTAAEAKFSTGDGDNTDGISGGGKRRKKSKKKKSKSKHKRSRKSKRKSKTRRRR
jgi:hypothetical protein